MKHAHAHESEAPANVHVYPLTLVRVDKRMGDPPQTHLDKIAAIAGAPLAPSNIFRLASIASTNAADS